jgi:hypothetical protein
MFDINLSLLTRLTSLKVISWLPLSFQACRDVIRDNHELCREAGSRDVPIVLVVLGRIDRGKPGGVAAREVYSVTTAV